MLKSKIESILFVTNRPLTTKKLAEICGVNKKDEVVKAVEELAEDYASRDSGIRLLRHGDSVQMATSGETADLVREYLKDETTGELTKPSLETLTIVAYRGPLTKSELEQLRGVNCSLILRNLMMRGLVECEGEHGQPLTKYQVTMDFLRFLGVSSVEDLPDYSRLRSNENVERVLSGDMPDKEVENNINSTEEAEPDDEKSSTEKERGKESQPAATNT